jgi:hypothetical protein
LKKIEEGKTRLTWQVDPARPDQKPGCNPLIFVFFFIKTTSFDLKKLTRTT